MASPNGSHEEGRLRVLAEARIGAAPLEPALERICQEARQHFEVAISLITLVERQWLVVKAACGIGVTEIPRDGAFCTYNILSDEVFVIPVMSADERFRHNPWVTGEPHTRFMPALLLSTRRTCAWAPCACSIPSHAPSREATGPNCAR